MNCGLTLKIHIEEKVVWEIKKKYNYSVIQIVILFDLSKIVLPTSARPDQKYS